VTHGGIVNHVSIHFQVRSTIDGEATKVESLVDEHTRESLV
jgi:hypothetical protein